MKAISWFDSADGRGFERVNGAFITLLPKKEGAVDVGDFRPISLVHSFGKLVSKLMAARLASSLPELVDCNQSAFVKGRAIQDNFFMLKQSIRSLHRRRTPALMLKVDMAKAVDSVAWPFLFEVMRHRGFGPRGLRRVTLMLSSSSMRVLVNGQPGDQFWHGRGLRQGDPGSPMFFIMVLDVLNAVVHLAEEVGLFGAHWQRQACATGCRFSPTTLPYLSSHLLKKHKRQSTFFASLGALPDCTATWGKVLSHPSVARKWTCSRFWMSWNARSATFLFNT